MLLVGAAPCDCTMYIVHVFLRLPVSCQARRMNPPLATPSSIHLGDPSAVPARRLRGKSRWYDDYVLVEDYAIIFGQLFSVLVVIIIIIIIIIMAGMAVF